MSRALQILTIFAALLGSTLTPSGANAQGASAAAGLPVELREVTQSYAADGVIEAVRQATVSSQIAGTVTRFFVDAGDTVKAGQVLAHIDTRETDAQVAINRAQVAQAEAQLSQARLNLERTQQLLAKNFVSQA